ncbi:MAG TPA: hypothetical protein VFN35_12175, partial [Ktedonobacteraceae bacterium]|nr:hypothetical protein [Ktedonobacteraceae bacterium]
MLLSQKSLRSALGILWLIDGLLQLQPRMFTPNMADSILWPTIEGQPAPIAASLHSIVTVLSQHLTLTNVLIAIIECEIGLFLLAGLWVRGAVIVSIVWSILVWYGGEGMSMLFTGQASILTGAPGAVLLYALLGLLVYPRKTGSGSQTDALLSRRQFRWILAGFWIFAALLQCQPYWWEQGSISRAISEMVGQGGLDRFLLDPSLQAFASSTVAWEIPLNIVLIELFLGLGIALVFVKQSQLRPWLVLSIVFSVAIWWGVQALGLLFTGMTTDVNSGPLLILMALACWPVVVRSKVGQKY